MATKTENTGSETVIELTQAGILTVRLYARLKRAEKFITDSIAKAKARLLAIGPVPTIPGDKTILVASNSLKTASIACQDGRSGIDLAKLERDYPDAFQACKTQGAPFVVIRLH